MSAFDPSEQASFLADDAGTIITWNPQCAALFGLAAADALGRDAAQLLGAPPWPELLEAGAARLALPAGRAASVTLAAQLDASGAARSHSVTVIPASAPLSEAERLGATALKDVVDLLPGTFYILDREGRILMWNHNLERVCEMMPEELATANAFEMLDPRDRGAFADKVRRMFDDNVELEMEVDYVSRSGRETPVLLRGARIDCKGGQYLFGMGMDISKRRAHERQLHLYKRALGAASNGVIIAHNGGPDHPTEYVNPAFERITGYAADEIIGRDPRFMAAPGLDADERNRMRQALHEQRSVHVVLRNLRKNGELFWNDLNITPVHDDNGQVTHFVGILVDVTASKQRADRLEHEVNHDSLTGLANRTLLWDRLDHALHLAQRHQTLVAAVLIDLDNFKIINDTFGHDAGDAVLKVVARRLQATVRDSDTVARLSGDEFVAILGEHADEPLNPAIVQRVMDAVAQPVMLGNKEFFVTCSIGVAVYPSEGTSSESLIEHADIAMYRAKKLGRNNFQFYTPAMNEESLERVRIESALRNALERNEFVLHYQPQVDLKSGQIVGMEALIRWNHPELGMVPPGRFVGVAEETGLIVQIGAWVMRTACAQNKAWQDAGLPRLRVAVNLSARQFGAPDLLESLESALYDTGLDPACLEIELTESLFMSDVTPAVELLHRMKALGVNLSIDDFGTGYSSFSYLSRFPIDVLKIDRSFVADITHDANDAAIVTSIIALAHNLKLAVIAEGVETAEQLDYLRSHGCDEMQGYYFSKPLPADDFEQLLRQRRALPAPQLEQEASLPV
ncbi:MAG TPA: bifunctional diguanylate cyclase/phosphodiesterase [Massilia timonae]|nr:bifunctional diguanylate cyclase/phosphodiesterase [Massilia timonae]